ncbi:MAG: SAM-dependent methyltransferase [Actinomycetota bacterium]|nr:SAM-dependent methyltransferase [Actinomycetota bacterium]
MTEAATPALDAIRDAIEAAGPITFAEFMDLALYGPGGFYESPPVGPSGDFVTSPHVHPVFCELVGAALRELHDRLGRPTPLRLAEVGAGDGTLARSMLAGSGDLQIAYTAVERSPGARRALSAIERIEVRTELSPPVDVVLGNELLDNLPFRVLRGEGEVRIGSEGEQLIEVLAPAEPGLLASTDADHDRIAPVGALAFIDALRRALERGYALLIDYGGLGTTGGPVHGYRGQAIVEDVLASPGATDITAGVDFELIASYAGSIGLTAFPSVTQRDALLALGLGRWMGRQLGWQNRSMDAGRGTEAVRTWSSRSRASLLIDPGGLGRLRWMLLATPGLAPPPWLERASARSTDRAGRA